MKFKEARFPEDQDDAVLIAKLRRRVAAHNQEWGQWQRERMELLEENARLREYLRRDTLLLG